VRILEDWERTTAVAIGVVTLGAALLTYWAVLQDDASSQAREQATLETLQLERQDLISAVRVQGETAAADRYRRWLAEAEALEREAASATARGDLALAGERQAAALEDRYLANGYQQGTFDGSRMTGTTATSTYDVAHRLETVQGYGAYENVQPGQPAYTAHVADRRHDQSVRTLVCVVLLLLLVVVLTLGRVVRQRWRPVVLAVAGVAGVAVGASAVLNGLAG
jgi:hypothetical protein